MSRSSEMEDMMNVVDDCFVAMDNVTMEYRIDHKRIYDEEVYQKLKAARAAVMAAMDALEQQHSDFYAEEACIYAMD